MTRGEGGRNKLRESAQQEMKKISQILTAGGTQDTNILLNRFKRLLETKLHSGSRHLSTPRSANSHRRAERFVLFPFVGSLIRELEYIFPLCVPGMYRTLAQVGPCLVSITREELLRILRAGSVHEQLASPCLPHLQHIIGRDSTRQSHIQLCLIIYFFLLERFHVHHWNLRSVRCRSPIYSLAWGDERTQHPIPR